MCIFFPFLSRDLTLPNPSAQFFLGFSQPDHLQLSTLTLDGEVAYTRAHFDASSDQSSSTCVILNASCSEVSDSLPIWSLESQCFFWVREYEGDKCDVVFMLRFFEDLIRRQVSRPGYARVCAAGAVFSRALAAVAATVCICTACPS